MKGAVELFNFVVTEGALVDADRYATVLRELGVTPRDLQRLRLAIAEVSGTRRGVLEVRGGTPALALRPLAPAPSEITVHAQPIRDERLVPGTFGPDVGWQQSRLAQLGAHEGLLVDGSSRVISAIMNPLLVVEPGRVRVSSHPDTTDSITLDSVLELLSHQGVEAVAEQRGFDRGELMEREVWVIDPVYGARLVDTWIEYGTKRPARLLFDRAGVPSHREVNEVRRRSAATV